MGRVPLDEGHGRGDALGARVGLALLLGATPRGAPVVDAGELPVGEGHGATGGERRGAAADVEEPAATVPVEVVDDHLVHGAHEASAVEGEEPAAQLHVDGEGDHEGAQETDDDQRARVGPHDEQQREDEQQDAAEDEQDAHEPGRHAVAVVGLTGALQLELGGRVLRRIGAQRLLITVGHDGSCTPCRLATA